MSVSYSQTDGNQQNIILITDNINNNNLYFNHFWFRGYLPHLPQRGKDKIQALQKENIYMM